MAVQGGPQYAAGAKGKKGDPVELTRRAFSDEIEDGDAVEPAGYPEGRGNRTVRIVRDGKVVATVEYFGAGGGWLQDNYTACESF